MNQFAKIYGDSLYDLALEEKLTDVILNQMEDINKIFSAVFSMLIGLINIATT